MMPAAGGAAEEIDQAITLAVNCRIRVHSMIGDHREHRVLRERRRLNHCPQAADQRVKFLQYVVLRHRIVVEMREVVVITGEKVEIEDLRIKQLFVELALNLLADASAERKSRLPLIEKPARTTRRDAMNQAALKRSPKNAALVELEALIALLDRVAIDQQRDAGFIQYLHRRHVDLLRARVIDVERKEVHVVEHAHRVAVVLGVAMNHQVLPGVEQGPRGYREADASNVEVPQSGALLMENVFYPRKLALARDRIPLAD